MQKVTRAVAIVLVATIAAGVLGACNTVKGVGQDIESVGEAGSDAMKKK